MSAPYISPWNYVSHGYMEANEKHTKTREVTQTDSCSKSCCCSRVYEYPDLYTNNCVYAFTHPFLWALQVSSWAQWQQPRQNQSTMLVNFRVRTEVCASSSAETRDQSPWRTNQPSQFHWKDARMLVQGKGRLPPQTDDLLDCRLRTDLQSCTTAQTASWGTSKRLSTRRGLLCGPEQKKKKKKNLRKLDRILSNNN